ncbi:MAG: hypothetical protein WBZ36_10470 [Candidatus Nitrosopolaris sp.]
MVGRLKKLNEEEQTDSHIRHRVEQEEKVEKGLRTLVLTEPINK